MIQLDSVSREQLGNKDLKIKQLQAIDTLRCNQLIQANLQLTDQAKDIKRLKHKIVLYKILCLGVSLGLIVSLF